MTLTKQERVDFAARRGITSRLRPGRGHKHLWRVTDEVTFPLPVIVDYVIVDGDSGCEWFKPDGRRIWFRQAITP